MKPQAIHIRNDLFHSFVSRVDTRPDVNNYLHFHTDLELIYFKKGSGMQHVGDSIIPFNDGHILLVGKNIPHYWRLAPKYFDAPSSEVEIYVIHFDKELFDNAFFGLPEFQGIRNTLEMCSCSQYLQLSTIGKNAVGSLITRIVRSVGAKRLLLFIDCLSQIGRCKGVQAFHASGFHLASSNRDKDRLGAVYKHTLNNYKRKIDLREIAATVNVSPTSFCRFFKATSKKTYTRFLNEVRIGQACKMLSENQLSIKEVCYESGYSCFTSFYKHFRKITGKTPLVYQKECW
ncbi:AraC family transcriptional regulator [Pedobacter sp. MC2016-05]|uniref:helix-turn-helix domain-containing protein n=1 Tax=Pedobacter sp. MC2016-05 TaxID=2994474 RepID=UPI002246CC57|nr:AraC family transcriptional regulator [Pedobacter sp. MC2016-05]MCX2473504.1 AraC family transcriptional regulator [Pedobacter sp. MC2016-05]